MAADASREERLERLFAAATALPPERRAAFLDAACGADGALRASLESLTTHAAAAHAFVDRVAGPAVACVAGVALDRPTAAPHAGDPLVGRRVAHFQVLAPLGSGGMGRVYRAVDLRLDRTVALKFLPAHLGADSEAKQRLAREARAASTLDHPNICAVHEIGETERGELFIAMACCDGETLRARIARGPLSVAAALDCAAQIAEGLQHAHEAGLVHRDVKPGNVMCAEGGRVRLVDFGLARAAGADVTRPGATVGTIGYMSPEQTRGAVVDARSDVWSAGAVLYEMLTGWRPFRHDDDALLIHAIRHDAPPPLEADGRPIPASVAAIVARCLAKDPARRYPTAAALLADVRVAQAGGTVRPPAPTMPASHRARARAALAALAALAIPLLVARARPTPADDPVDSLAVLPVTVPAGDAVQAAFAEEMTDLLINQLSQLGGLRRVVARDAVLPYRDAPQSSRRVGRALGVRALVRTEARRENGQVRLDVRVIDAATDRVTWSGRFTRPMRDVLTLQREVTQAVARALRVPVTAREAARLAATARAVSPAAFALYLQSARVDDAWQGMAYLERAVASDSTFALAHARLAVAYVMLNHDRARAERAIATALALDPSLSEAYDALGLLRMWVDWDWPAAEAALRRAVALNPHNSRAHHEMGQLLMRLGRCDEAVAAEQRAVLENPGVAHFQSGLAEVHLYCRQYDAAVHEFGKVLGLVRDSAATFRQLGDIHHYQGRQAEALALYRRGPWVPGWAYAPPERERRLRAHVDSLTTLWRAGTGPRSLPFTLARLHTSLGEHARALDWLERALAAREGLVVYLGVHPHFDPLRAEPRFGALLRKVGLDER